MACAGRMASTPSGEIFHCDQHVFVQLITYEVGTLRRGQRKTVFLPPLLRVMLSESVTQKSHLVHTGLISLATISNQFNLRLLKIASSSDTSRPKVNVSLGLHRSFCLVALVRAAPAPWTEAHFCKDCGLEQQQSRVYLMLTQKQLMMDSSQTRLML